MATHTPKHADRQHRKEETDMKRYAVIYHTPTSRETVGTFDDYNVARMLYTAMNEDMKEYPAYMLRFFYYTIERAW